MKYTFPNSLNIIYAHVAMLHIIACICYDSELVKKYYRTWKIKLTLFVI